MALQLILSNWLVCVCLLALLVGMAAMLLSRRPTPTDATESSPCIDLNAIPEQWTSHRPSYAEIRGKLDEDRIWIGGPLARGGL